MSLLIRDLYVVFRCGRDRSSTSKRFNALRVNVMAVVFLLLCYEVLSPHSFVFTPPEDLFRCLELVVITLPSATDNKRHLISGVYIPDSSPHSTHELLFSRALLKMINDSNSSDFFVLGDLQHTECCLD